MKKILVTGGAGYIGSHTIVELLNSDYLPVIVDNFSNSDKSVVDNIESLTGKKINYYELDCRDSTSLKEVFKKEMFDGVIHFAAYKSVRQSVHKPLEYYDNNVISMINVLEAMQAHKVSNIVFSSSCTVYGQIAKLPVTEEAPLNPSLSPYGSTKQIGEMMINDQSKAHGVRGLALRYFNAIGAHPSGKIGELPLGEPTFLVPNIMRSIVAKDSAELVVFGNDYPTPDGTCVRDYIHVVDLARAHVKALDHVAKQSSDGYFDAVNIGTGRGDSVLQVIKAFERVTKQKISYRFGPRGKGDAASSYAVVEKAQKMLGWKAENSLEDSIRDAWNWQLTLNKKKG